VIKWFLDLIYRVAGPRVRAERDGAGPPEAGPSGDRPLIVLSRHAGPGDSLLLIHYLLSVCERRPRVVMKATLQTRPEHGHPGQPRAQRVPAPGWLSSRRPDPPLAVSLDGGSALAIFP